MGEIILIISITLILTVVSSFWLGYSYGKLRTIKSVQSNIAKTFDEYLTELYQDYQATHSADVSRETSERTE